MAPKRPRFDLPWHLSEQPAQLRDPALRRRLRRLARGEHLAAGAAALLAAPLVAARLAGLAGLRRPTPPAWRDLVGIGIAPHPGGAQRELVEELGVRHLALRLPTDPAGLDRALACLAEFPDREVLPVILQDRGMVCDLGAWRRHLARILAALPPCVRAVQLGCAINRLKWGCVDAGEYLALAGVAREVFAVRPGLRVVGPGLIDFEPLPLPRILWSRRRPPFAALALALYVDRRGGPSGRQFGLFNLARKLDCFAALAGAAPRCRPRLWITEVNWPLAGTGDWSPTSPVECVDEEVAAGHLTAYYETARASRLVERVYWWRLIHPGFGLVDDRDGLRRRPAFAALRGLLRR